MGYIPTNKRDKEIQLMRFFLKYNHCEDVLFDELNFSVEHFGPEFQKLNIWHAHYKKYEKNSV